MGTNTLVCNFNMTIFAKMFHSEVTANFNHFDAYKESLNDNINDDRNELLIFQY